MRKQRNVKFLCLIELIEFEIIVFDSNENNTEKIKHVYKSDRNWKIFLPWRFFNIQFSFKNCTLKLTISIIFKFPSIKHKKIAPKSSIQKGTWKYPNNTQPLFFNILLPVQVLVFSGLHLHHFFCLCFLF